MSKEDDILHYHEPNGEYVPVSKTEQSMILENIEEEKKMEEEKGDEVVIMEEPTEVGKPIQENEIISLPNREYGTLNYYIETGLSNVLNSDILGTTEADRKRSIALLRDFSRNAMGADVPSKQYDYTEDLLACEWKVEDLETISEMVKDLIHMNQRNDWIVMTNEKTGKPGILGLIDKYKNFLTRNFHLYYADMANSKAPLHTELQFNPKIKQWVTTSNKPVDLQPYKIFKGFGHSNVLENDLKAFLTRINWVIDYLRKNKHYPNLPIGNNCYSNPDYLFFRNEELFKILPFETSVLQNDTHFNAAYLPYERIHALIHQFIGKDNYIITSTVPNKIDKNYYNVGIYMDIYGNFQIGFNLFNDFLRGKDNNGPHTYAQRVVAQRVFPIFRSLRQSQKDSGLGMKYMTSDPEALKKFVTFMQRGGMRALADSVRKGYTLMERYDEKKPKRDRRDKPKPKALIKQIPVKNAKQIKLANDRQKKLESIKVNDDEYIDTEITSKWEYLSDNQIQVTMTLNDKVKKLDEQDIPRKEPETEMEIDDIDDILAKFDQEEKKEEQPKLTTINIPKETTSFIDAATEAANKK